MIGKPQIDSTGGYRSHDASCIAYKPRPNPWFPKNPARPKIAHNQDLITLILQITIKAPCNHKITGWIRMIQRLERCVEADSHDILLRPLQNAPFGPKFLFKVLLI